MKGSAARNLGDDAFERWRILDQQIASRGAHEYLDARRGLRVFQRRDIVDRLARTADIESEIAEHAVARAAHLVGECCSRGGQGLGVRHLEHGRDAAQDSCAAAGLQVFLLFEARLAEVHLAVDYTGQDVQPLAVDDLGGLGSRRAARTAAMRPPRMAMSRTPVPSWLTIVPLRRRRS